MTKKLSVRTQFPPPPLSQNPLPPRCTDETDGSVDPSWEEACPQGSEAPTSILGKAWPDLVC
ncbi:MAG: hypothetical protein II633_02800 [Bacteroidales bacterium]|nr:hypothetical protein [Bacteroidales bacterium]